MIKGLLFDLDGVIISTVKYHFLAWKRIADELGLSFTEENNELLKGVSRTRSFEIILELNNKKMSDEEIAKYCEIKNGYYRKYLELITENDLLPGVKDFLLSVKEKGYKISLGSASKNSPYILEKTNIKSLFDALVDGNMVSKAKPNPEVFLKGAETLGFNPEECLVFEDAAAGIEAAHAGGMKAVGVGNLEVKDCADLFIPSFVGVEIEDLVK